MFKTRYKKHILDFRFTARTSRGAMQQKETFFIQIKDEQSGKVGFGECSTLKGLSIDAIPDYENHLIQILSLVEKCETSDEVLEIDELVDFPSIKFGLEIALADLESDAQYQVFDTPFSNGQTGIPINGLIWMGDKDFMFEQIKAKLDSGFDCIKIKVGGIDFEEECSLMAYIRQHFSEDQITIRVDANGAFTPDNALEKLKRLSDYKLHSIEQPIKAGQIEQMSKLCELTPLDIALDEELIGVKELEAKELLLNQIKPQYIILKPSLVGGFISSEEWILLSEKREIGWWMTSALEANVGLNAIAQFTSKYNTKIPQGLGTGQLYHNNIGSPLEIKQGKLFYNKSLPWNPIF
ncbi:o-succinylbenzoate synthase [Sediminitomix flava]|uniref:O-succinylbenzoate synthase n=1 Tax=Sediminitomix flava TaxID=379075 RepID=A0A315Z9T1_SEDFL|nr:o-succinylbenzoate synthase [Sediminitomix flava]PWJ42335.1 o-succinylbenzoate synthase [Sediminitomix flava]